MCRHILNCTLHLAWKILDLWAAIESLEARCCLRPIVKVERSYREGDARPCSCLYVSIRKQPPCQPQVQQNRQGFELKFHASGSRIAPKATDEVSPSQHRCHKLQSRALPKNSSCRAVLKAPAPNVHHGIRYEWLRDCARFRVIFRKFSELFIGRIAL